MAFIKLYKKKLQHNYNFLSKLFAESDIEWAIVTKVLCGNELFLAEVLKLGIKEVCDSRVSNLAKVKEIDASVQTVYIKPPAKRSIPDIVKYTDVSFNTELQTINWLSEEAVKQKKIHKVIIMIELGDLREGVMGEELMSFYGAICKLPNIKISGIGANLNCLHGVMPSQDKLVMLSLYKQLIEAKFNIEIPWVTGGTSVVIPLLFRKQIPRGINHFRVGEMLYFANDLFTGDFVPGMEPDVFKLYAEVIEITEKPKIPSGTIEENPSGELFEINEDDYGKTAERALLDIGLLDMSTEYLIPEDDSITITGASSDMIAVDLTKSKKEYKVGDLVAFKLKYMGALSILNSDYVEKIVE